MPYQIGIDNESGARWFMCLREGCKAHGRKSHSRGDVENRHCSVCGYHEEEATMKINPPPKPLKMYILVRDSIDIGHAVLAVGHGVLAAHRMFSGHRTYDEWFTHSFRKVVCKVNDKEFEAAKEFEGRVVMTESGLDGEETCIVFSPREEWPKPFRFYKLYR